MAIKVGASIALVTVLLAGCATARHVSLKDIETRKINKPAPIKKATASSIILAPVIVVAPTKETATDLEAQMMIELASLGYRISDTGTWRIMGVATGTSVQWTLIDQKGAHVATVSQENPQGDVSKSASVIASSAALSLSKLLPNKEARP